MAVSMCGLYLADIILLVAGPIALNNIGWRFFLVLIIPTALHIGFVYFMCPETKGRSLVRFDKSGSHTLTSPIQFLCLHSAKHGRLY